MEDEDEDEAEADEEVPTPYGPSWTFWSVDHLKYRARRERRELGVRGRRNPRQRSRTPPSQLRALTRRA